MSLTYYCAGATLMTSCGFVDAILYSLTRRVLVTEMADASSDALSRSRTAPSGSMGGMAINMKIRSNRNKASGPEDSTENIFGIVKTETFEVTEESVHTTQERKSSVSINGGN